MTSSSPARKKSRVRSASVGKVPVDAWAEKLLHMILGATMTQVALCRFLIREDITDRQRLLTFLEERGVQWSKTSSDEALLPLITILTRVKAAEEPDFPVASARSKLRRVWQTSHRATHRRPKARRKMTRPRASAARKSMQ
jgi:hypothetical protein